MSLSADHHGEKAGAIQLPPASEPQHRSIAHKAAEYLGRLVDGNGLKAGQIRLSREETLIHRIPAAITVRLTTEVAQSRVKGNAPQGTVVGTPAEAVAGTDALVKDMISEPGVRAEINDNLKKDYGQGFGLPAMTIRLASQRRVFSVVGNCPKCAGAAFMSCAPCGGAGSAPCLTCAGHGFSSCKWCHGAGMVQAQGASVPCTHCQGGQTPCPNCRGNRTVVCMTCRGQGRTGCTDCGQTGSSTEIYQVDGTASCTFDVDWRDVPGDVRSLSHKMGGVRELATKGHAEIIWQEAETKGNEILVPCAAFLPVANVEFMVAGQAYAACVAGLRGRIVEIGPILDKYVKPGIAALMKLSKGPLAQQALIDTACRYRLIRQVLAGLTRQSKKTVYQRLGKTYPMMLSDKYARATVKYAAIALDTLSARPRYKGLAAGTALAALPAAVYYLTPLRSFLLARTGSYIAAADIAFWLAGAGLAIYTIRLVTARALKKVLPETVVTGKGALPSAGRQGYAALLTAGLVYCAIAAAAPVKPGWILSIMGG